ncbi:MAG: ATP-binding protein [Bacteroidia bacterium]|nr:ATP-binding protein [Bacteroidia bacterium]
MPKIISLLGPRRAGKTYLLFHLIQQLRTQLPADRIVYINFEDDRLFPLAADELDALIRGYYALYPENKDQPVYFFFDEIQDAEGWERFVRRISDQEQCRIYLTGSSSKLLSRELASSLRVRTISYEVLPLSFREFLRFRQTEWDLHSSKGQAVLAHELGEYLKQGGFPELVFLPADLHRRIIQEYIDLMLYRDLTERFSIRHPQPLKYLLKFLLVDMGRNVSIHKGYQDLKSQGYEIGKNTVYEYLAYLEEAFAIFRVPRFSHTLRQQAAQPSKVYGINAAFKYAMSSVPDAGQVFENTVFLELRRRGIEPYYVQGKQEADFYAESGLLINACLDISAPDTRKRELSGLAEAMQLLNLSESQLITLNHRETLAMQGRTIRIRPLWDFLLGPP